MPFRSHSSRYAQSRPHAKRLGFGLVKLMLFAGVAGAAAWLFFQHTVDNQLRDRVQAKISEKLQNTGLTAHLGQARFHEGEGIQLNDLQIELAHSKARANEPQSRVEIYEAFIHAPVSITELASTELEIRAVELRRIRLTAVRNSNGEWDFAEIAESLAALRSDSPIPISLSDCEVQIIDTSGPNGGKMTLTDVNLFTQPIVHQGRPLIQVEGNLQSSAISKIEFTTYFDVHAKYWQAEIRASEAKLASDLIAFLPSSIRSELQGLQTVSGKINVHATATGKMSLNEIPDFSITGNVDQLTVDDVRLPFPIRNVAANFEIDNRGFTISQARGMLGMGAFSGNYWQVGFLERQKWHCDGNLNQFNFDHSPRLARWLPEYCKKFCVEYSPTGTSNIEFDLTHDGSRLQRRIIGELTNMSFSYFQLPYRVENSVGKVTWVGDACNFEVRSFSGKEAIELKGIAKGLGREPTYEINISVPGELPIDQKMHDAISAKPSLANVVEAFTPTGRVGGIGKIEKQTPDGPVRKTYDIRLKRCSILHTEFDYPIHNIVGLIHIEDDEYTFSELSGNNRSGHVTCNANWNPTNGLNARFLCKSVPLDDQLQFALKPDLREIWKGFRPRGTMDFMRIDMRLPINAAAVDLNVEARMEKPKDATDANHVSINPVWFPYEINHLTGSVRIGDGEIKLKDIEGRHQRTTVFCQGDGRYSNDDWSVKLKNMLVTSLKVDEDLFTAVPKELAPPIRQLKYQGLLGVSGEITIAGSSGSQASIANPTSSSVYRSAPDHNRFQTQTSTTNYQAPTTSLAWDVRFDLTQAKMLIGVPVENVFGNVKLVGLYDGQTAECRGELDIDSMTIYDSQITNVHGPIWMDNSIVAAGQFSRSLKSPENLTTNLSAGQPDISESVTGQLHKGILKFDANMASGGNNEYFLQATLTDGCLSTACRDLGADSENIDGHSFAAVRLAGDYSGIHSQRGDGTIQLRDAEIYELPAFLSMLKVLKVRQVTRTAFDSSNIDFTIQGENIDFHRMEFIGDAISLIGNGKMNLDRDIDLNFYSIVGRNRVKIPILSELYHASSQRILWIRIDGNLENPQFHRELLPGLNQLNDSLRELFQPRESSGLANRLERPSATTPLRSGRQLQHPNSPNTYFR